MNSSNVANDRLPILIRQQTMEGRNELYQRYACVLYGVIKAIVTESDQAEEALQQTFNKIFEKTGDYNPSHGSFLTWAMQVARATSIAYLCNAKQVQQPGYLVKNSDTAQVELILLPNIDVEPTEQDVLAMVLQGCKAHELAAKLNIPVDAVKMKIRKAMLLKANRA